MATIIPGAQRVATEQAQSAREAARDTRQQNLLASRVSRFESRNPGFTGATPTTYRGLRQARRASTRASRK